MRRYELREDQWLKIAPLLLGKVTDPGRSGQDNCQFVQAVLWIARSGAPWRDLPERFGRSCWQRSCTSAIWNTVFQRFNRWSKKGIWQKVFEALRFFNRLKHYRRLATCYEKQPATFWLSSNLLAL